MATNHYVNNNDFLQAIKAYKADVEQSKQQGLPKPRVPEYIGECILKIASHLSLKPNFINYSYRDEMIGDGIENCLTYIDNFNPDKSTNPFAYFTQIIYYAFIRRIQKEKKQTLVKGKIIMDMPFEFFDVQEHDDDGVYTSSYLEYVQNQGLFEDVLQKDQEKKQKSKKKTLPTLEDMIHTEQQ